MTKITISAVGDISFGDSPKCLGFGVKSKVLSTGADFIFDKIKTHLTGDIIFGNLEVVLSDDGLCKHDFKSEQLRGSPSCAKALAKVGFNVLNVANNHAMQHGLNAFSDSNSTLERNGVIVVGKRQSSVTEMKTITIGDKFVGFLGYSFQKDKYASPDSLKYACCVPTEKIITEIANAKRKVDWLVLSAHWGLEFIDRPSLTTIRLARTFIDAGADIIIGHHPHVLQGVETYKNGVICYSLGNFIFDMEWNKACRRSVIIKFFLHEDKKITYKLCPIFINRQYQPEKPSETHANFLREEILGLEKKIPLPALLDSEEVNFKYYKLCRKAQLKDTFSSNLFLLKGLAKTPVGFLPGKLKYILDKFY